MSALAAIIAVASANALDQQEINLRLKTDQAATYSITTTMRMTMSGPESMDMKVKLPGQIKITPSADGPATFSIEYAAAGAAMTMNGETMMPPGLEDMDEAAGVIPALMGKVDHTARMSNVDQESLFGDDNPMSPFGLMTAGLQGVVFPDHGIKPGDIWEGELENSEMGDDMSMLLMLGGDQKPIKYYYMGNEVRNGRTLAKIRMTMRFGINGDTFGAGDSFGLSIGSGAVYFVDVATGIVRYTEGETIMMFTGEGQTMNMKLSLKAVTDTNASEADTMPLWSSNEIKATMMR